MVMVVDDDEGTRIAIREVLYEDGYAVTLAVNGRDAVAKMEQGWPDLLLTDLEMPEVGGEALVSWLRARAPNLPVIVVTSRLVVDAAREATRLGANAYLNKPIDIDRLLAEVKHQLAPA